MKARIRYEGLPVVTVLVFVLLLAVATGVCYANWQVNQDPPGNFNNSPSIALDQFWRNMVVAYTDSVGTGKGIGVSWCPLGVSGAWTDSPVTPPAPPGWLGWEQDASVAADNAGLTYVCHASYDQWQWQPGIWPPLNSMSAIYVSVSADGGMTFPSTNPVSYQPAAVPVEVKPKITVDAYATPASPLYRNAYVIWQRTTNLTTLMSDICFSASTNQGTTWSAPAAVINDNAGSAQARWPHLAVGPDHTVYAAWIEIPYATPAPSTPAGERTQGTIWVDCSTDGGQTWGQDIPAVVLMTTPLTLTDSLGQWSHPAKSYPCISVDPSNAEHVGIVYASDSDDCTCNETRLDVGDQPPGNTDAGLRTPMRGGSNLSCSRSSTYPCVYAVYTDHRNYPGGTQDVYFHGAPVVNRIAQWRGTEVNLCTQSPTYHYYAQRPSVVSGGSDVHVAWDEYVTYDVPRRLFIYYNGSHDYGLTWGTAINLDTQAHGYAVNPMISSSGSNVCVVWQAGENPPDDSLFCNYSADGGLTWAPNEILVHGGEYFDNYHDIAQAGGYVYLVWTEAPGGGTSHVYVRRSNSGGQSWSAPMQLDSAATPSMRYGAKICCNSSGDKVYVAWCDDRNGGYDIYFACSHYYGLPGTWSTDIPINTSPGANLNEFPQIACDGDFVGVSFVSDRSGSPGSGPWDVYLSCSADSGVTWQEFRADAGTAPGANDSYDARVSVYDYGTWRTYVYVDWLDNRNARPPYTDMDVYGAHVYWDYSTAAWVGPTKDYRVDMGHPPGMCTTANPQIASDYSGPFYLFQDDRNGPGTGPFVGWDVFANQISTGPLEGEIFYVESTDRGQTWSNPIRVNDDPPGQPYPDHTHPWFEFKPSGIADVAWMDKRNDPLLWDQDFDIYSASIMGGAGGPTVMPNALVTNMIVTAPPPAGPQWVGWWVGDYIGVDVDNIVAHIVWTDTRNDFPLGDIFYNLIANPQVNSEWGDAPEGAVAYPSSGVIGQFPTCGAVGPAGFVQHYPWSVVYFGPGIDWESNGNAGFCPNFSPYDADECFNDGDAGLIKPAAVTIQGGGIGPCSGTVGSLGLPCSTAVWGRDVDIQVFNGTGLQMYVNVLADWDQDGQWQGYSDCPEGAAPEHVLVNFPVPATFAQELSNLAPPSFLIGPHEGHIWTRFTISPDTVAVGWNGSSVFQYGETEDYLVYVGPFSSVEDPGEQGLKFHLYRNSPNPFSMSTTISYDVPRSGRVSLNIYDVRGRLVRRLVDGTEAAGHREVRWGGKDLIGEVAAPGIYFYRLEIGSQRETRRMILLR